MLVIVRKWPWVSWPLGITGLECGVGIVRVDMGLWASGHLGKSTLDCRVGVSILSGHNVWASGPLGKSALDCRVEVSIVSGHGSLGLWASWENWCGVWGMGWYSVGVSMGLWASGPLGKSALDCRIGVSIVSGHGSLVLWASWGKWSKAWGVGWYSERVYMSLWASGHLRKSGLECGVWVGIVRECI